MVRVKGCVNEKCAAFKKKITYKESEEYCSKCGQTLSYVCKKCYTPLEEKGKYCAIHQAEKDDKADHTKKVVLGVSGVVLSAGAVVFTKGKDIVKNIPKLK